MARITGRKMIAGFKKASTFGTAVQIAAGDGLTFNNITHGDNPEELRNESLGLGLEMSDSIERGKLNPSVSITGNPTFQDAWLAMIAAFFGVSGTPTSQTDLELHRMTMDLDQKKFGTFALESTTTTVLEYTSAYPNSLNIEIGSVPSYLQCTVGMICGEKELSTSTNTNANMASASQDDSEYIIVDNSAEFEMNAQGGGALSGSDQLDIMSYSLNLTKGLETVSEIKGASGLTAPRFTAGFEGTLSVTLSGLNDHTHFTAANAGTEYKSQLVITGTTPGTDTKTFTIFLPRMVLIEDPTYNPASQGENEVTLNFQLMQASANPTGMNDTTPYIEVINGETAAYV